MMRRFDLSDAMAFVGLVLAGVGLYMMASVSAVMILSGFALVAVAIAKAKRL